MLSSHATALPLCAADDLKNARSDVSMINLRDVLSVHWAYPTSAHDTRTLLWLRVSEATPPSKAIRVFY